MPVHESIDDDDDDDSADNDAHPAPGAPRQSYNFAPGYHGVVYRADVPDWGAGPRREGAGDVESHDDSHNGDGREQQENDDNNNSHTATATAGHDEVRYKLQSMKWGLVPSWTSRNPDYKTVLKTINCRDDSLSRGGGMWASMKARKRCVVVAQGFYEWLKKDGARDRDKIPHYVRRRDGRLLCMAGLWDVVQYEGMYLCVCVYIFHDRGSLVAFCHLLIYHKQNLALETNNTLSLARSSFRRRRQALHLHYYHH